MLASESERTDTLILAWRLMISTFTAILAGMEVTFVLVDALTAGYFESSRTSFEGTSSDCARTNNNHVVNRNHKRMK
jgi:hypothetical protein